MLHRFSSPREPRQSLINFPYLPERCRMSTTGLADADSESFSCSTLDCSHLAGLLLSDSLSVSAWNSSNRVEVSASPFLGAAFRLTVAIRSSSCPRFGLIAGSYATERLIESQLASTKDSCRVHSEALRGTVTKTRSSLARDHSHSNRYILIRLWFN
jgi:hypothetical protein